MNLKERYGMKLTELSKKYKIPYKTLQGWNTDTYKPPAYVIYLIDLAEENERKIKSLREVVDTLNKIQ